MQLNSQTMGFCVCVGLAQHSIPVEVVGTLAEEGTPVVEDTMEASAALQSRIVAPHADHN